MNLQEATKIVSQGVGFKLGHQLLDDPSIDKDVIFKVIGEVFAGDAVAPDEEIFKEAATIVQEEVTIKLRAVGAGFLDVNKDKKGIVVTESGLQYRILKDGEGDAPKESDQVTVHYTGKLVDGSIFDSSIARGEPAQFAVNQVIPGWIEGLQLMTARSLLSLAAPGAVVGETGGRGKGGCLAKISLDRGCLDGALQVFRCSRELEGHGVRSLQACPRETS